MGLLLVHSFLFFISITQSITVHGLHVHQPYETATAVSHTGAATYDNAILMPPPVPDLPPPTSSGVQLETGAIPGPLIPQHGSFFGFKIDLSVAAAFLGLNSSYFQELFLNLIVNIRERAGRPVGVGGFQTVKCDQTHNICDDGVPAPGATLVFLAESDLGPMRTFPTNAWTNTTIDPGVLTTSDGNKGITDGLAGSANGTFGFAHALSGVGVVVAVFTFVCLESLLSYAVTGHSVLGSMSKDTIKNAL